MVFLAAHQTEENLKTILLVLLVVLGYQVMIVTPQLKTFPILSSLKESNIIRAGWRHMRPRGCKKVDKMSRRTRIPPFHAIQRNSSAQNNWIILEKRRVVTCGVGVGLRSAKLQMNPLRWICTKILIVRDLSPAGFPDSDWVFLPSSRRCVDFGSTKINTAYDQSMAPAQMR